MQKSRKNAHLNFTIGTNEFCDYTYAVIAAAANQTGKTISNKLQLTPLKDEDPGTEDPEPKPEQIDITFSTGELLYLPNGMLLINLFETDNTSVYQTQIKLEGIENNGA